MPCYEFTCVAHPDLSKADVESLTKECSELITKNGGSVVKTEYWGLRQLAYKINKTGKGHYLFLGVDAPSAALDELERTLRINESVLRMMCIKVDAVEDKPSAPLRTDEYDKAA